mmetsp:Transcript_3091/g.19018  ORF Transcript_3091/g.19018 Transcript_3091/m.19018 type:complete len:202 (+) Transcript_3091:9352-9957(+)
MVRLADPTSFQTYAVFPILSSSSTCSTSAFTGFPSRLPLGCFHSTCPPRWNTTNCSIMDAAFHLACTCSVDPQTRKHASGRGTNDDFRAVRVCTTAVDLVNSRRIFAREAKRSTTVWRWCDVAHCVVWLDVTRKDRCEGGGPSASCLKRKEEVEMEQNHPVPWNRSRHHDEARKRNVAVWNPAGRPIHRLHELPPPPRKWK